MIADNLILDAQKAWGEGIVKIGKVFLDKGDYKAAAEEHINDCLLYTSPSPRDATLSRMPSSA